MKVFIERSIQWRYTYDDIGVHAPTSVSEVGNRTTAEGKTYTANNLNQYIAIDDFAPQYDDDGNQTLIKTETGIWSVLYNAENRPIRWQSGDTVITMAFDRMGRRVEMRTMKDGAETLQRFVYDNYLCVQQLRGADNALFHSYVWDPTEPIATRPLVFQPASGEVAYYFHDGNKNVSDLVDIHGSVVHYDYTAFGVAIVSTLSENPVGFSSEFYDISLGLVYYNYRHYNPFISNGFIGYFSPIVSGEVSTKTRRNARAWALHRSARCASLTCPSLAFLVFFGKHHPSYLARRRRACGCRGVG